MTIRIAVIYCVWNEINLLSLIGIFFIGVLVQCAPRRTIIFHHFFFLLFIILEPIRRTEGRRTTIRYSIFENFYKRERNLERNFRVSYIPPLSQITSVLGKPSFAWMRFDD